MTEPMDQLHARRRENFAELVEGGEKRLDALFATVPALGELAVGTVYGHLHERPALDSRTRKPPPWPLSSRRGWSARR